MIGALMYLTSNKPDIVHATCLCAWYQANPTEKYLKEVKRIFRCLWGTVNMDLLADKQSGRPYGSLPSNTQTSPRGNNSKAYQPPKSHNEHVNVVFTRSGKSYDPPVNPNDHEYNYETPINFDSDDEDDELAPQPKTQPSIDVIDEILKQDFNALLDEGSKILNSIEGNFLEEEIFFKFDKFISMASNENCDSESDEEEPKFRKITINTDYKIKKSLKEPSTDLELKPLPDNLEYVFLEEPSFLPVIISSQLSTQNNSKFVSVLKNIKKHLLGKQQTFLEKCHLMVKEGIVLGHKAFDVGLEVDKAKIYVIFKIPPLLTSKMLEAF
nr:reverse transcriptase domain-containing protein [Tanacetum cinerariifolium]